MKNKKLMVALSAVLVICLILVYLEVAGVTHLYHHTSSGSISSQTPTRGGASVDTSKGQSSTQSTSANNTQPGDTKNNTGGDTAISLKPPSGDFVSNHKPSLSGTSSSDNETSVCVTTPGAACVITFTKDDITKSLNSQTTDRSGSTYWNWKLEDIGLTSGIWKVTATATLNSSTSSASDPLELQVTP